MGDVGAEDGMERSRGLEVSGRLYEGSRAVDGRERGRGWEVSQRLYGVIGEKSIDFRKILYRLFRKTL